MLEDSRGDIGRFQGLDRRRNDTEPMSTNLMGRMGKTAEDLMLNFTESGHPVFRVSSTFARDEFRSKGKGFQSIHFNGSDDTIELILRTIISVNQLSVYGAVADLCEE